MTPLVTDRLFLLPLSRAMLENRLRTDEFTLRCDGPAGPVEVRFPPAWPGDALPMFPGQLAALGERAEYSAGTFAAVDAGTLTAIGQLGIKGVPDGRGAQEIGYGFNPETWGRGLATEAVGALVAHLLARPGTEAITAETAVGNRASRRVLEKNQFTRVGTGWDADDGDLLLWERLRVVVVRGPHSGEAAEIAEVIERSKAVAMPWLDVVHTPEEVADWVEGSLLAEHEVLVAADGDRIVGVLATRPGWVDQLYLLPEFRRRGIGSLFLRRAMSHSAGSLQLWTFQRNRDARAFYERHGFRAVEETDGSRNEEREPDVRYIWEQ